MSVSKVSPAVPTRGEEGFGRDARAMEPFAPLEPVIRENAVVGSGGGIASTDVARARWPRIAPRLLTDIQT